MRSIRYIRSEKMEKSIWRMILQPVMDSVIPQNIRHLHMTASDQSEMSASLEYHAMDGTKMTESFAVNMEVDLDTYLPVYKVRDISKGTDRTITEEEYEAYGKECTWLTDWKPVENQSAKKKLRENEDTDIRSGLKNGIRTVPAERRV